MKNFCVVIEIFAVLFDPHNFCNGSQLQCGLVPGEFLVFSLLPGIGRAWYHWLYIVVDQTFTSGGGWTCTHLFIDHRNIICVCLIFMVDLDNEIILTAKFSRSMVPYKF